MSDREQSPTDGPEAIHDPAAFAQRPAAPARGADHAATTFQFGGGAEATDFLGLSQEIPGMDAGSSQAEPSGPTGQVGGRTHPGEYPTQPENSASWLLQTEPIVGEDESQAEGEEFAGEAEDVRGGKRSFSTWTKIAAALLFGAGATFGFRTWQRSQTAESTHDPAPTIAHTPTQGPSGLPTPSDPTSSSPSGSAPTGTDPGTHPGVETTPRLGQQRFEEWIGQHSGFRFLLGFPTSSSPTAMPPADSYAPEPPGPELAVANPGADPSSTPERILRKDPNADATPARAPLGGLRLATPEELAGIWPGDTIPMEALDADTRLLTPAVGLVHVIMKTGEIFDGRLYAIGAGQVWLEASIGRLALDGKRVSAITMVTTEEVNGKTVEDLPRMRVRTPGGIFFGKVVSREDDRVTILTDDGGRITLVSRDVEAAPLGDTRVIGRVEKH
ncbi:MAG: hypothetical protein ACKVXR_00025 [Planctomycetota bacterium]